MTIAKTTILHEIDFCLELWEKQGGCSFGKKTSCEQCSALYVLWKLYTGNVLDGQKLSLEERKKLLLTIK